MDAAAMNALLAKQKAAHLRDGEPSAQVRIDRIDRAIALLIDNRAAIEEAINQDFGSRSREATTCATPLPRITAPISTGGRYWSLSVIQMRWVGSSER